MLRLRLCFCELRTNFCRLEAENGDFGSNFERVKLPEMPIFCPQEMAFFFSEEEKIFPLGGNKFLLKERQKRTE